MHLTEVKRLPKDLDHKFVAIAPNSKYLALERETCIELYSLLDIEAAPISIDVRPLTFTFSHDSTDLAIAVRNEKALKIYNLAAKMITKRLPLDNFVFSIAYSPDNLYLAVAQPLYFKIYNTFDFELHHS
jgi:WD40 repeat protein